MSGVKVRQGIVLSAGLGSRLRPITETCPKPLVPFFGRPLIAWAIAKLLEAGVSRVGVNLHHLAPSIREYLKSRQLGVALEIREEAQLSGTGGGVRQFRDWLIPGEPFYILNADAVFQAPLRLLGSAPSLLVTREPRFQDIRRLECDAEGRLRGVYDTARDDGWVFCGVSLADPELPQRLPEGPSCVLRQGFLPYLEARATEGQGHQPAIQCVETDAFFADTGTARRLTDAHHHGLAWVRELPASFREALKQLE